MKLYSKLIIPPKDADAPQNKTNEAKNLINFSYLNAIMHIIADIDILIINPITALVEIKSSKAPYNPPINDEIKIRVL